MLAVIIIKLLSFLCIYLCSLGSSILCLSHLSSLSLLSSAMAPKKIQHDVHSADTTPPSKRAKKGLGTPASACGSVTTAQTTPPSTSAMSSAGNMETLAATAASLLSNGAYNKDLQEAFNNILTFFPQHSLLLLSLMLLMLNW